MSTLNNLNSAITLLLQLTAQAGRVSLLIASAREQGRDLSDAEMAALQGEDAAARVALLEAIATAKAAGT